MTSGMMRFASLCRKTRPSSKNLRGFSLLELLAVVTILGIIALVVIPRISVSSKTAKENACRQNIAEINSAAERYYFDNGSPPATVQALVDGKYLPGFDNKCPYNPALTYSLDAEGRVTGHTHE